MIMIDSCGTVHLTSLLYIHIFLQLIITEKFADPGRARTQKGVIKIKIRRWHNIAEYIFKT